MRVIDALVLVVVDRNQCKSQRARCKTHDAGHFEVMRIVGIRPYTRFPDVIDENGAHGVDQGVRGAHQGRGQGGQHQSEDARNTKKPRRVDKGVGGAHLEFSILDERAANPSGATGRYGSQRRQHKHPTHRHFPRVAYASNGQEPHDDPLVHQYERAAVGQAILDEDADETELIGRIEFGERKAVPLRQQCPKIYKPAQMHHTGNKHGQAGHKKNNALRQVGHDDGRLPSNHHVQRNQHSDDHRPRKHRPAQQ